MDSNELKKYQDLAKHFYDESLPYHNFQHALHVLESGKEVVARCRRKNVPIDEKVVYLAILFHDAGYHEDHLEKGFATKEDYSIEIAERELRKLGLEEKTIEAVKLAIGSTHRESPFPTNEMKAVRVADLAGLAKDYETFQANARCLRDEQELLTKKKIGWEQWKALVKQNLEFYLAQDIRLTSDPQAPGGSTEFHKKARANLERFLAESE